MGGVNQCTSISRDTGLWRVAAASSSRSSGDDLHLPGKRKDQRKNGPTARGSGVRKQNPAAGIDRLRQSPRRPSVCIRASLAPRRNLDQSRVRSPLILYTAQRVLSETFSGNGECGQAETQRARRRLDLLKGRFDNRTGASRNRAKIYQ